MQTLSSLQTVVFPVRTAALEPATTPSKYSTCKVRSDGLSGPGIHDMSSRQESGLQPFCIMHQPEEEHAGSTGNTKTGVMLLHLTAQHLHCVQQDAAKHLIECLQTEHLMPTHRYKHNGANCMTHDVACMKHRVSKELTSGQPGSPAHLKASHCQKLS